MSIVPAVPGFEDNGAVITSDDIRQQMKLSEVVGLGEMMNFPGIHSGNEETHTITGETLKADKIITGHYSIPDTGKGLSAYIASGAAALVIAVWLAYRGKSLLTVSLASCAAVFVAEQILGFIVK